MTFLVSFPRKGTQYLDHPRGYKAEVMPCKNKDFSRLFNRSFFPPLKFSILFVTSEYKVPVKENKTHSI